MFSHIGDDKHHDGRTKMSLSLGTILKRAYRTRTSRMRYLETECTAAFGLCTAEQSVKDTSIRPQYPIIIPLLQRRACSAFVAYCDRRLTALKVRLSK